MNTDIRDVIIACLQDDHARMNHPAAGIALVVSKWLSVALPDLSIYRDKGTFVFHCHSQADAQTISDNLGGDVAQNALKQWIVSGNMVDLTS